MRDVGLKSLNDAAFFDVEGTPKDTDGHSSTSFDFETTLNAGPSRDLEVNWTRLDGSRGTWTGEIPDYY